MKKIEEGIELVNSEGGFQFNLDGIGSSHHIKKDENIRGDFSEKRWKRIRSNIPSYKQFYNKNTIEKVSSLYAEDIERYGYSYGEKV